MRINPKAYHIADEATPIEVQEFDSRVIKIFSMNEFDALMDEFINKGKFAVWSSEDGVNYHLYVEDGYYNELKQLHSKDLNKIWVDFWDKCENITKKSTKFFIPITLVAVLLCLLSSYLPSDVSVFVTPLVVVVSVVGMLTLTKLNKKKVYEENVKSVEAIKKRIGADTFENLLEKRKEYVDKYYESLYPDEDEEVLEENVEE